ncbi:hypothetical protein EDF52_11631 [Curtobacterium sp. PhB42]|nr:hypothetical protein EDF48_10172 [Curtobacterium sp. PhB191]TDW41756.1 hypothetical protein EDF52_11631 [Curtobacterium sp. PhB42]TDW56760.1 hypothetical protein EDF47_103351 [Curtobacterium sp. PhB190]
MSGAVAVRTATAPEGPRRPERRGPVETHAGTRRRASEFMDAGGVALGAQCESWVPFPGGGPPLLIRPPAVRRETRTVRYRTEDDGW